LRVDVERPAHAPLASPEERFAPGAKERLQGLPARRAHEQLRAFEPGLAL
jgi:hypothetical protein